jgi:hypothetical protein
VRRLTGYKPFRCLAFGSAAEHQSPLAGEGEGIYSHPFFALHPHKQTDPLSQVDRSTIFIYFIAYVGTNINESKPPPIPYPPQMRNGGLPPAHLPSSSLSNPSAWRQYKWSQPPPHAPDWVCDAPDNWIGRALHKDQQADSLLPPKSPGGPIVLGACTHAERAYQDWKWAVDELWEDKRHRLQTAAHQGHLDKETARQRQEANHRQQLLDEHAAYECQEAARHQRLLDEETAHHQCLLD